MMMPSIFGENLFDDFMNDFRLPAFPDVDKELYGKHAKNLMKTDVKETEKGYEVDMDLPGFKKDEIQMELNDGVLTISAAKGLNKDEEDKKTKKEREKGKGKKENGEKIAVVLKCPKCGQGEIVKGKTAWGCTLYRKSCDFLIPMEIQGKKLTQKQVDTLIQKGQTGKISGFKDPEGNSFNGIVRLDENKNIIVDKI